MRAEFGSDEPAIMDKDNILDRYTERAQNSIWK